MIEAMRILSMVLLVVASCTNALTVTSKIETHHAGAKWGVPSSTSIIRPDEGCAQHTSIPIMSATLDRPTVNPGENSGPAVLDRPIIDEEIITEKKTNGSGAWEVRIYNDGTNTREFVARCLVQITALSESTAYQTMMQAHHNGIAVVGTYVFELAEMYHDALQENGIVCDLVPVEEDK